MERTRIQRCWISAYYIHKNRSSIYISRVKWCFDDDDISLSYVWMNLYWTFTAMRTDWYKIKQHVHKGNTCMYIMSSKIDKTNWFLLRYLSVLFVQHHSTWSLFSFSYVLKLYMLYLSICIVKHYFTVQNIDFLSISCCWHTLQPHRLTGTTVLQSAISDFTGLITFLFQCYIIQIHMSYL